MEKDNKKNDIFPLSDTHWQFFSPLIHYHCWHSQCLLSTPPLFNPPSLPMGTWYPCVKYPTVDRAAMSLCSFSLVYNSSLLTPPYSHSSAPAVTSWQEQIVRLCALSEVQTKQMVFGGKCLHVCACLVAPIAYALCRRLSCLLCKQGHSWTEMSPSGSVFSTLAFPLPLNVAVNTKD